MPLTRETKERLIGGYAIDEGDTGSPEVQIALLTERIRTDRQHLRASRRTITRDAASSSSLDSDVGSLRTCAQGQRPVSRRHRPARPAPLGDALAAGTPGHVPTPGVRRAPAGRSSAPGPSSVTRGGQMAVSVSTEFGGRTLTIETGKLARLAGGAVTVRYGDTVVLGHGQPLRTPARARLLPAHGRLRGADVRRRQDPGRLHQARIAAVGGGDPRRATDRPADPPAVPRGLQGRRADRPDRPLDRPGERPGHPRHDRRVRRAHDQRDPVPRARSPRSASAESTASSS